MRGPVAVLFVISALTASRASAEDAEAKYYKAYYLEVEAADPGGAAALYEGVVGSGEATPELKAQAAKRLAGCREELRSRDLARLAPPDSLLYLELRDPGAHIGKILELTGISSFEISQGSGGAPVRLISPSLIEGLEGLRNAAMAITDMDPRSGMPSGVAILDLGRSALAKGLVETALSSGVVSGNLRVAEPVGGHPAYSSPLGGSVVVTERLVVAGMPHDLVVAAVERLGKDEPDGLRATAAFAEVGARRERALLFGFANLKAILEKAKAMMASQGGIPEEYRMAQAIADFESVRWAAISMGAGDLGVGGDLIVKLDDDNRALPYHLFRTPPLGRAALSVVPAGSAGFLAFALSSQGAPPGVSDARAFAGGCVTGLDLGREIFANIRDVAAFVLPDPPTRQDSRLPPLPHAALVFTARDPAFSDALWKTVLGVGATLTRARSEPVRSAELEGRRVDVYAFPESVEVYVARLEDRLVVATSEAAVAKAMAAAGGRGSVLEDEAFSRALSRLSGDTSKVLMIHAGRAFQLAQPFAHMGETETRIASAILGSSTTAIFTNETPSSFEVGFVSGLPHLGPIFPMLVPAMMHRSGGVARGTEGSRTPAVRRTPPVLVPEPAEVPPAPPAWKPEETQALLERGSIWRFLDSGDDPDASWREPSFDDSAWRSGAAPLGYGEEDLATTVGFGGDAQNRRVTTYFRTKFSVESPESLSALRVHLRRDDGAAVYINGKEVVRDNLLPGSGPRDLAPSIVGGELERQFFVHVVPVDVLHPGENSIAVEVHQSGPTSSDVIFDLALEGRKKAPAAQSPTTRY